MIGLYASHIGLDVLNQVAYAVLAFVSLAVAAITIAIVHASTKNKRVWGCYPLAALIWIALLYLVFFVIL